jgi:outer membrane receptor protein involved in Fe transport
MKIRLLAISAAMALVYGFSVSPVLAAAPKEIDGVVNDALGRPLAGAHINLKAPDGQVVGTAQSDTQGHFTFTNVAPGTYALLVDKDAFQPGTSIVTVSPTTGVTTNVTLASTQALEVHVAAQRLDRARNGISVETGSSVYRIDHRDIAALPQGEDTPVNQVLLRAPGVAQDSFGQFHVRGDHADLQYRLNGIVLPESISGFGQTLDTRFIDSINLLTGALPAQYGYRTAGVVDIHTKTGELQSGGNIGIQLGSHNSRELSADVSGSKDKFSYYLTSSVLENNLGIENPTAASSATHDHTSQHKEFGYFSYLLSPTSRLSLIVGNADSRFQIPAIGGQTPGFSLAGVSDYPSSKVDERQHETNRYAIVAFQGTAGDDIDYQVAAFSRYTKVLFEPDPVGDLLYTGVASRVLRTGLANGVQADASYRLNASHTLRTGLFYTHESLDNSNNSLTFPAAPGGSQASTQPISVADANRKGTDLGGVYLQDEWKLNDKLTINYGARADWVNAYVTDNQLSPRLGVVYKLTPQTTLHAGYAKYFTPPPSELVAQKTIASFQGTTNAPPTSQNDPVKAESADYFDAGISQQIGSNLTLGLDGYYKKVDNLLDEGQFGSALLFTPFNYRQGKIYGLELTANYRKDNFAAYASIARSTAMGKGIVSSQYNFGQDELDYIANHWVHLDHDQQITASVGTSYLWRSTTYSADAIFGSGLRSGFANADHLPAYSEVNVAAAHTFKDTPLGKLVGRVSVVNLFDKTYEIRDGSGIGVGAPQYGQRRSFYLSASKSF